MSKKTNTGLYRILIITLIVGAAYILLDLIVYVLRYGEYNSGEFKKALNPVLIMMALSILYILIRGIRKK